MSVEFYRESPGKFGSRTLNRKTLSRWTGRTTLIMTIIIIIIASTVSFHNFKSQNFKLSVSNPKSKCVAYVSVLSQISIGGLGVALKVTAHGASALVHRSWFVTVSLVQYPLHEHSVALPKSVSVSLNHILYIAFDDS